jgi:hypothetical protein
MAQDILGHLIKGLDRGFYKEARGQVDGPRASYGYLSDLLQARGIGPSAAELAHRMTRLLRAMGIRPETEAHVPQAWYAALEDYALDSYGLDKALTAEGIRVKGASTDKLEKFFATTTSTILFPTYVESQVVLGILATSLLPSLVATETNIDAHVYEALAFTDTVADQQMTETGEGAGLATTKITTADRSIRLKKFGRMLEVTYEALRLQRMNVVNVMLRRLGTRIALDETDSALDALLAGDGNTGSAITNSNDIDAAVALTLNYAELVKLALGFTDGYTMTTAVTRTANMQTILNMAEFKDPLAGFSFQRTGILPGPMGASWHRWDSTGCTHLHSYVILAVDNRLALEQVTEQGVMTESDRLIDKQFERTAISKWTGFAKMDYNATQALDVNAEI